MGARRSAKRQELEAFVRAASLPLYRTAYALTWDIGKAEDLVQETFLRLDRHWDRARSVERPLAYARRVLVNLALDRAAKQSRQHLELVGDEAFDHSVDASAARALRAIEDTAELRDALLQLTPRQQAILVLRYLDDLPEAEVAQLLGCSASTVSSTASRAASRLAVLLRERRPPPSSHPVRQSTERAMTC